ncbi:MAG: sigma-70 family RNA polymerase sigma factor [Planctomycetota bacterium]
MGRAALEGLVRAHFAHIRGLLERLTGSAADAEDLAQECFLRARRAGDLPPEAERGWLVRVAVNLARDHGRRRGRARRRDELAARARHERRPSEEAAEAPLERDELRKAVQRAVAELPERLRVPLVLRTFEGWSYDAIATHLGLRTGTVRVQVMEARRALERSLGPLLDDDSAEGAR